MNKKTEALALASLQRVATDARQRAELLAEVVRTRGNLKHQEEMYAHFLGKRRKEVEAAEAAATAAGIDLTKELGE